jgi:hypothetical protein
VRQRAQGERTHVEIGAGLRQRGASGVTVRILDLSTHGFRARLTSISSRVPTSG